jgi:hypothetical protein
MNEFLTYSHKNLLAIKTFKNLFNLEVYRQEG